MNELQPQFYVDELCILLDAVMIYYKAVEQCTVNDDSNLTEIDTLQHKIEKLLSTHRDG